MALRDEPRSFWKKIWWKMQVKKLQDQANLKGAR
jgi:hypothetical protein